MKRSFGKRRKKKKKFARIREHFFFRPIKREENNEKVEGN